MPPWRSHTAEYYNGFPNIRIFMFEFLSHSSSRIMSKTFLSWPTVHNFISSVVFIITLVYLKACMAILTAASFCTTGMLLLLWAQAVWKSYVACSWRTSFSQFRSTHPPHRGMVCREFCGTQPASPAYMHMQHFMILTSVCVACECRSHDWLWQSRREKTRVSWGFVVRKCVYCYLADLNQCTPWSKTPICTHQQDT